MKSIPLILAGMVLMTGAASAQKRRRAEPILPSNSVPVQVTVKTDKATYTPGGMLVISGVAKNTQKDKVTLQFASGQKFDIEIREGADGKGKQVYLWSKGKLFTEALTSTTINPGASVTYSDQTTAPTTPGTYTLRFTLTTQGRTPRPFGMTLFTIK